MTFKFIVKLFYTIVILFLIAWCDVIPRFYHGSKSIQEYLSLISFILIFIFIVIVGMALKLDLL